MIRPLVSNFDKGQRRMCVHTGDIEAAQQPVKLLFGQTQYGIIRFSWPGELCLLQPFVPETETGLVPIDNLHLVALSITEQKQGWLIRRVRHRRLDNHAQTIDSFAEVDRVPMQEDRRDIVKQSHARSSRTSDDNQRTDTSPSQRMATSPTCTLTRAEAAGRATCTGTKGVDRFSCLRLVPR